MIEALLTILCLIIPFLYIKSQEPGFTGFTNNDSYPKRRYKPRKHYLDDVDIPDTHCNTDLSRDSYIEHLMSDKWKQTKLTQHGY